MTRVVEIIPTFYYWVFFFVLFFIDECIILDIAYLIYIQFKCYRISYRIYLSHCGSNSVIKIVLGVLFSSNYLIAQVWVKLNKLGIASLNIIHSMIVLVFFLFSNNILRYGYLSNLSCFSFKKKGMFFFLHSNDIKSWPMLINYY